MSDTSRKLPTRVYFKNGAYYFVAPPNNKWIRLGKSIDDVLQAYEKAVSGMARVPAKDTSEAVRKSSPHETAKMLMKSVIKNAKPRGLSVEITESDICDALERAGGRCEVTGIAFSATEEEEVSGKRRRMWLPSLDRIDSRRGYETDNIRVVCSAVNVAMSNFGDHLFMKIAAAAVTHSATKQLRSAVS